MKNNFQSTLFRVLIFCRPRFGRLVRRAANLFLRRLRGRLECRVHGFRAVLKAGNNYPLLVQDVPLFNAPLVELCHQVSVANRRACQVLDIGSATGDSVFLLKSRCAEQVGEFVCVEGDEQFFDLLSANMSQFSNVRLVRALLASEPTQIPQLVKHHLGTAAALGEHSAAAMPLDSLPELREWHVDLLKVDVDGFDGEVLAGATGILKRERPAVIFEWHPFLAGRVGKDCLRTFQVLRDAGYDRLLWFHNLGEFSHHSAIPERAELVRQRDYLLAVNSWRDQHYDVIALHASSSVDTARLAIMEFARKKAVMGL
jgi:FkbM family methyltransferase